MSSKQEPEIDWSSLSAHLAEQCSVWKSNFRSTSPIDRAAGTIKDFYRFVGKDEPLIVYCESPFQIAAIKATLALGLTEDSLAGYELGKTTRMEHDLGSLWQAMWIQINSQIPEKHRRCLIRPDQDYDAYVGKMSNGLFGSLAAGADIRLPRPCLQQQFVDSELSAFALLQERCSFNSEVEFICSIRPGRYEQFKNLEHDYRTAMGAQLERPLYRQLLVDSLTIEEFAPPKKVINKMVLDAQVTSQDQHAFDFLWATTYTLGNAYWMAVEIGLLPLYASLCDYVPDFNIQPKNFIRLELFLQLARQSQFYLFLDPIAFVSERPVVYQEDSEGRLHSATGPALAYSDGYKLYSWHGNRLPKKVIEHPEELSIEKILSQGNVEIRRIMIERFGVERFLEASKTEKVNEDEYGVLYRMEFADDEPLVMVKVLNSTPESDGSHKSYFLRVPPTVITAHEAVAWTFRLDGDEYSPAMQT